MIDLSADIKCDIDHIYLGSTISIASVGLKPVHDI
jgi:hypothetical protein